MLPMRCTDCHLAIDFYGEDITVTVVFKDGRVEKRCHHNPFDEADPGIVAILGSQLCYDLWREKAES